MATIVVHINNGETAVEIPVDDLPSSDDLIQFLSEEKASLSIWLEAAVCINVYPFHTSGALLQTTQTCRFRGSFEQGDGRE